MNQVASPVTSQYNQLSCSKCGQLYNHLQLQTYATCCSVPLTAGYNLTNFSKASLVNRPHTMWRYKEVLPILNDEHIVSLGEGFTPYYPYKN